MLNKNHPITTTARACYSYLPTLHINHLVANIFTHNHNAQPESLCPMRTRLSLRTPNAYNHLATNLFTHNPNAYYIHLLTIPARTYHPTMHNSLLFTILYLFCSYPLINLVLLQDDQLPSSLLQLLSLQVLPINS